MTNRRFVLVFSWLLLLTFYVGYNEYRFRQHEKWAAESSNEILEGIREIKQIIERTSQRQHE